MATKKTILIYNPRAGRSGSRPKLAEILSAIEPSFGDVVVKVTAHAGHAREIAATLEPEVGTVICCGGDGTLNEVVSGLLASGSAAKIAYIPIGSTNDLAKNIGIPTDLAKISKMLQSGSTNGYDVASFNERYFNYFASFGPGVSVSYSTPQKMKNLLGYSAYMINGFLFQVIPTLRQVKPKHIRLEYDGNVIEDDFYFGAVSNALSAAGIFKYNANEVCFNDGKFEVMLVRRLKNPMHIFPMLVKMRKRDYDGDTLLFLKASELHFQFDTPVPWTLDGEFGGGVTDVKISVHQNAVRIHSPQSDRFLETPQSAPKLYALLR